MVFSSTTSLWSLFFWSVISVCRVLSVCQPLLAFNFYDLNCIRWPPWPFHWNWNLFFLLDMLSRQECRYWARYNISLSRCDRLQSRVVLRCIKIPTCVQPSNVYIAYCISTWFVSFFIFPGASIETLAQSQYQQRFYASFPSPDFHYFSIDYLNNSYFGTFVLISVGHGANSYTYEWTAQNVLTELRNI